MKTYGAYADIVALEERVAKKLIVRKEHPTLPGVALYNYTQNAQFEKAWDEHTIQARGLVVDKFGRILARPFPKFFNHDDPIAPPDWNLPFTVHTKYDGSLFIVADSGRITATRGSFASEQAKWGREILATMTDFVIEPNRTYLFELIHPDNRIVVDYGDAALLICLAIIETDTGYEYHIAPGGVAARALDVKNAKSAVDLLKFECPNSEGFVVRFSNGMRTKIKFDEYKRLHKIVTGCSTKTIWETLRDKKPIESFIENVPDEFFDFVKSESEALQQKYAEIYNEAALVTLLANLESDRKSKAIRITKICEGRHPSVKPACFALLDKKDHWPIIWRGIEPEWKQPFASRGEI